MYRTTPNKLNTNRLGSAYNKINTHNHHNHNTHNHHRLGSAYNHHNNHNAHLTQTSFKFYTASSCSLSFTRSPLQPHINKSPHRFLSSLQRHQRHQHPRHQRQQSMMSSSTHDSSSNLQKWYIEPIDDEAEASRPIPSTSTYASFKHEKEATQLDAKVVSILDQEAFVGLEELDISAPSTTSNENISQKHRSPRSRTSSSGSQEENKNPNTNSSSSLPQPPHKLQSLTLRLEWKLVTASEAPSARGGHTAV